MAPAPTLLAAGAVKSALEGLRWPPPAPVIGWGTVGALRDRVLAGERPAAVILSDDALAALAERGLLRPGPLPLGRTGIGLALRSGGTARPIDTPDAFAAALLAAGSIGWADAASGATAGRHFEAVIERLGIAAAVRAKATLFRFGVDAVAACGRGEVELAVSQSSEIAGRPGVTLLGAFPAPFALSTGYAAAALAEGPDADAILAALASPAARAALLATGFAPP